MTTIQWHQPGDKVYENGLDRGVLYVDGNDGVAWNGLTSVKEKNTNKMIPVHWDGIKINDIVVLGSFEGSISAFTYPDEFYECEGLIEDQDGVYLAEQRPSRFGMSYRTLINNDLGIESGYKLHVLYNLTARPKEKTRNTLGLQTDLQEFEWDISSIPEHAEQHHPTAHVIFDSRKIDPWLLTDIEEILYGTDSASAQLPSLSALTSFIRKWDRLIINDNGDGTWTAISAEDGIITMLSPTEFEIEADNVVWLDPPDNTHFEISSSDKNEEDI
ncbi:hypothetical protein KC887_04140 [Candidatus Kaiserbacteria bacterium]|nr:hypothetical protein [Candidatus Kaiserbacteria bacterium]